MTMSREYRRHWGTMQKRVNVGIDLTYLHHHLIALFVMWYPDRIRVWHQLTKKSSQGNLDSGHWYICICQNYSFLANVACTYCTLLMFKCMR